MNSFPPEVVDNLKNYVYRLIDPRNGETFYVGRGVGNRLYCHIKEELGSDEDSVSLKLQRIRSIRLAGFEILHVVHRHGMEQDIAKEVEAALIDAYSGLANIMAGESSGDRGVMHADEIVNKYRLEPAEFHHRALLVSINLTSTEQSLYDASRFAWKLGGKREQAEIVLACERGIIRGAFIPKKWFKATRQNFPGLGDLPGRWGFEGEEASSEIQSMYIGKRVPDECSFGSGNPIRYTWS